LTEQRASTPSTETVLSLQQLYAFQVQAIDAGAGADWASTFTDDGIFESPTYGSAIAGCVDLEEFVYEFHRKAGSSHLRHWFSTFSFDQVAEDRVMSYFYGMILETAPGSTPEIARSFVVVDEVHLVGTEWRVASRKVTID